MKKFFLAILLMVLTLFSSLSASAQKWTLEDALKIGREKPIFRVPKMFHDFFLEKFISNTSIYNRLWDITDISVKNTAAIQYQWKLYTQNDLLKRNLVPCSGGEVVVGITDEGYIRCGSKAQLLAIDVSVRSGSLTWSTQCIGVESCQVKKENISIENNTPRSMRIEPNQIAYLETANSQAEVVFSDGSLIRLDTGTKIELKPVHARATNNNGRIRTLAQASYKNGLLWGRVLSDDGPQFENNNVIAGVRGTSLVITADSIYALQSRNGAGAVTLLHSGKTIDMNSCSKVSTSNANPVRIPSQNTEYCLGAEITYKGRNDIITEHTKKDIAYLNTLIAEWKDFKNLKEERKISWPETVQNNSPFCPNNNVFWPNVTDATQMCQDEKVFAVATVTREKAEIYYRNNNDTKVLTGEIFLNNESYKARFIHESVKNIGIRENKYDVKLVYGKSNARYVTGSDDTYFYIGWNKEEFLISDSHNIITFIKK